MSAVQAAVACLAVEMATLAVVGFYAVVAVC